MPPADSLLTFALVSVVLIVIPGPSVMFVISRAISAGRRTALLTVTGNALGIAVQVICVAAGLGVALSRSIVLFSALRLVGAGYLVFLGIQAIAKSRPRKSPATEVAASTGPSDSIDHTQGLTSPALDTRRRLVDGFIVGVANPKLVVFFVSFLPQFTAPSAGALWLQILVLGSVFVLIALVLDSVWAMAAGTARNWFASSPGRLQRLQATGGAVMVGLGLRLAFTSGD